MGTLGDLGLIDWLAQQMTAVVFLLPAEGNSRLLVANVLIVWLSGIASALLEYVNSHNTKRLY